MATSFANTLCMQNIPWRVTFPLATWTIWTARNKFTMVEKPFVAQKIVEKIKALSPKKSSTHFPPRASLAKPTSYKSDGNPHPKVFTISIRMARHVATRARPSLVVLSGTTMAIGSKASTEPITLLTLWQQNYGVLGWACPCQKLKYSKIIDRDRCSGCSGHY